MRKVDLKKRFLGEFQGLAKKDQGGPLYLALSGGRDSTVLAHIALGLRHRLPPLHFVHVNYHLRRPDSDREEAFLKNWAGKENVPCHVKHIFPKSKPRTLQDWARRTRFQFFSQVIGKTSGGEGMVVLAHHERDQAETILTQMLRGAGLKGLGGMKVAETLTQLREISLKYPLRLFRPFLHVPWEAIATYAQVYRLKYFHDVSNAGLDYLRNRIRNQVLPLLRKENPNLDPVLVELGRRAREAQECLAGFAQAWLEKNIRNDQTPAQLSVPELRGLPTALVAAIVEVFLRQASSTPIAWARILERVRNFLENSALPESVPLKGGMVLEMDLDALRLIRSPGEAFLPLVRKRMQKP